MNNEYDVPVPSTICIHIYQSNHKRWRCNLTLQGGTQSNQIRQAVGDGNFEPSRLAQLADKLNNFRYELQLKLTDALTNQICSSKQKLDKPLFAFSFFQIKCDIFF